MTNDILLTKIPADACITFIGMPGAGKTTLGLALSKILAFAHVDTDYLIEALYSVRLQTIADALTKEAFLDLESEVIQTLSLKRAVISTGGSVVYRQPAMVYLKKMGPVVFLNAPLELLLERISRCPERGIAIAPGQTIEDLYQERQALYSEYADFTLNVTESKEPEEYVKRIIENYS